MMQHSMLIMALQSLLGLGVVLGLFALMIWAVRRFQQRSGQSVKRDFTIIQRIHLDNKNSIVEVRHQNRHYLLGLSPGGMVQLHNSDHTLTKEPATDIQAKNHE